MKLIRFASISVFIAIFASCCSEKAGLDVFINNQTEMDFVLVLSSGDQNGKPLVNMVVPIPRTSIHPGVVAVGKDAEFDNFGFIATLRSVPSGKIVGEKVLSRFSEGVLAESASSLRIGIGLIIQQKADGKIDFFLGSSI